MCQLNVTELDAMIVVIELQIWTSHGSYTRAAIEDGADGVSDCASYKWI